MTNIGLNLSLQLFSFSNCNINPNPTQLPKHQIPRPNNKFSQRIWYVECCSVNAHMAWSQKFRLTPVIQPPMLLQNVLFCLFYYPALCKMCVFVLWTSCLRAKINCEKVVPRLNKHDDVIEWNFMKVVFPRNKELIAPLPPARSILASFMSGPTFPSSFSWDTHIDYLKLLLDVSITKEIVEINKCLYENYPQLRQAEYQSNFHGHVRRRNFSSNRGFAVVMCRWGQSYDHDWNVQTLTRNTCI